MCVMPYSAHTLYLLLLSALLLSFVSFGSVWFVLVEFGWVVVITSSHFTIGFGLRNRMTMKLTHIYDNQTGTRFKMIFCKPSLTLFLVSEWKLRDTKLNSVSEWMDMPHIYIIIISFTFRFSLVLLLLLMLLLLLFSSAFHTAQHYILFALGSFCVCMWLRNQHTILWQSVMEIINHNLSSGWTRTLLSKSTQIHSVRWTR